MEKRKVHVEDIELSENSRQYQRRSSRMTRTIRREEFVYTGPPIKARNTDSVDSEVPPETENAAAIVAEEWRYQPALLSEEVKVELGDEVMQLLIKEEDPDGVIDAANYFCVADAEVASTVEESKPCERIETATLKPEKKPLLQLVKLTDREIEKWVKKDEKDDPVKKIKSASSGIMEQYIKDTEDGAVECMLCGERLVPSRAMFHLTTKCTKSPLRTCIMYNCSMCCASFTNHSVFLAHFRLHTKKFLMADSLCCEVCNKVNCKGLTEVDLKAAACHPTLACEVCQMVLGSAADYVEHKKTHWTGEYGLQCEHCSKKYRNSSDLKYHLRTQHSSTFQYNCVKCGIGLSTRMEVKQHKCPTRNPISTAQISVLNRVKLQRMKKNEKEPHTVVVFEDKESLFVSKDGGKKMFKKEEITCEGDKEVADDNQGETEKAEEAAGGLDTLADAAAKHQNSCEFCGKTFVTASGRHKHLKLMHGYKRVARANGPSSCCFCEQIFKSVYHLKEHIRAVHTDDAQFECDVCHKRYRTLKDRNYHKKTVHLGIYRYYCAKCGRGLHSIARLNRHNCNWGQKRKEKEKTLEEKAEKQQLQEIPDDKKDLAICRSWNKTRVAEPSLPLEVVVTGVNADKEVTFMMKPSEADI